MIGYTAAAGIGKSCGDVVGNTAAGHGEGFPVKHTAAVPTAVAADNTAEYVEDVAVVNAAGIAFTLVAGYAAAV